MTPEEEDDAETAILEALEYDNEANLDKFWKATRKMQRHSTLLEIRDQSRRFGWLDKVREFMLKYLLII